MDEQKDLNGSYDDVNIFGLDDFGSPFGLSAIYGALAGAGVSTLGAIGVRAFVPAQAANAELIGLGLGVAAGGAMLVSPGTRHAGWTAIGASILSCGLRVAEQYFRSSGVSGHMGQVRAEALNGAMGLVQAQALNGGMHGGMGDSPQAQIALMGGPPTSPLSSRYGASYLHR